MLYHFQFVSLNNVVINIKLILLTSVIFFLNYLAQLCLGLPQMLGEKT